jgi:hypothetical protein
MLFSTLFLFFFVLFFSFLSLGGPPPGMLPPPPGGFPFPPPGGMHHSLSFLHRLFFFFFFFCSLGMMPFPGMMGGPGMPPPPRQSHAGQDPRRSLFCGNISPFVTEGLLYHIFASCGPVTACRIIKDTKTGESAKYGFVDFTEHSIAAHALQVFFCEF